ncbi:MAG TPA: hypothetical protein VKV38_08750 [Trebonia sp.]|nr:hypothetical protein [Trebonia sp.]
MDPPTGLTCRVCRGPVRSGFARCYQCDVAHDQAGGLLADVVAPIGYAVKGGQLADDLWRYKSGREGAAAAAARLRARLSCFLRDHGDCLWRAAGMGGAPALAAVVPSGQGRPGPHPLLGIVRSCVELPVARLSLRPGGAPRSRGVDVGWLRVSGHVAGEDVLLVDDTWVSGGSAQSAAAALKLAGAARVAVVVLGRHLNPADPRSARLVRALRPAPRPGATARSDDRP